MSLLDFVCVYLLICFNIQSPAIVRVNKTDLTDRQSQSVITVELRLSKDEATGQVSQ
jgi:hypothetical protein